MKLEYIYEDNTYKKLIKDIPINKDVRLHHKSIKNKYIFSYIIDEETEKAAEKLSNINEQVLKLLDNQKLFILENEAAGYFNKILYPIINKFERLLRKVICVACVLNDQEKDFASSLEKKKFVDIYNLLFTSKEFILPIKERISDNKHPISKADLAKLVQETQEETVWSKFIKSEEGVFISENFSIIKDYRNDIMHAHNIGYQDFVEAKKKIVTANEKLEIIVNEILGRRANINIKLITQLLKEADLHKKLTDYMNISTKGNEEELKDYFRLRDEINNQLNELIKKETIRQLELMEVLNLQENKEKKE